MLVRIQRGQKKAAGGNQWHQQQGFVVAVDSYKGVAAVETDEGRELLEMERLTPWTEPRLPWSGQRMAQWDARRAKVMGGPHGQEEENRIAA